jgi:tetratricopeptide (TPR) repeat protein
MLPLRIVCFAALLILLAPAEIAGQHEHAVAPGEKLGTVRFSTSCSAAAQPQFNRAVALLHSFQFGPAIEGFQATLKTDPACAIAYWGIALSYWSNPFAAIVRTPQQLQLGLQAVEQGRRAGGKTERERAYIEAVARLYTDPEKTEQRARALAYEEAMSRLSAAYPDDHEALIFYALALSGAADPADKTYSRQLKAGAILEKLFAQEPDHPGLAHYIIHTYDFPPLAPRAIAAARRYSEIAPSAPHALHMPSHTFTRVGDWQDSIASNTAAGAAARRERQPAEELHTMDYRMYAYLQTGQDAAARRLLDELAEVQSRFDPNVLSSGAAPPLAGYFALAAIPARYALERGAWAEAARLQPHPTPFPYVEAMTYFARALGAAHTGDLTGARSAVEALQQIRERLSASKQTYWGEQVEIQKRAAAAWLTLVEGRNQEALATMRSASERESATEKNAVTPGPLAPASELLGEMLLQLKEPAEALKQFEATLTKEPNRFRAVLGAARAASLSGDQAAARKYYGLLLELCPQADKPRRPELAEAAKAIANDKLEKLD